MKKYMIETRPRDTKYYIESICHQFFPNSYMSSNSDEFKVGLSPSKKIVISFIESPLKLMKNAFYLFLKKAEKCFARLILVIHAKPFTFCIISRLQCFIVWNKCARKCCKLGNQKEKLNQDIIISVLPL